MIFFFQTKFDYEINILYNQNFCFPKVKIRFFYLNIMTLHMEEIHMGYMIKNIYEDLFKKIPFVFLQELILLEKKKQYT